VYNAKTGKKSRKSLVTPSWAEAVEIAAKTLRGMDPESAEARAKKVGEQTKNGERMAIGAACDLWIDRTIREFGPDASAVEQYRWLKAKVCAWAASHGIVYAQDITTLQPERWYSSSDWDFPPNTKSQRWGILRSMFRYNGSVTRRVNNSGDISWHKDRVFISEVFRFEEIGLEEVEDCIYRVFFRDVEIGEFDVEALRFRPVQVLR
jgi:hypothetical protein